MDAENFGSDYGGDGQAIKYVDKGPPDLDITTPFAFVVEAVHYQDLAQDKGVTRP